ncbi:MAG: ABC transporter permease [Brumimicrobium sp.]
MFKIYHAILKELRLLRRDLLGVAIIFLMPIVLIITITFIQDSIENNVEGTLPVLIANGDDGDLSKTIINNLKDNNQLKIITELENERLTQEVGVNLLKLGQQKILIVIPEDFSNYIQNKTDAHINRLLSEVMPDIEEADLSIFEQETKEVFIFFDPAVGSNVRNALKNAIDNMISKLETQAIYKTFENEFEADFSYITEEPLIQFQEKSITTNHENITPNAVQHNLPAWTLFAIFFIVIPLSINIVKEKNQGTYIRLKTLPFSSFEFIISKILVYLFVCMVQFYVMLLVSVYLFPIIGLPALEIEGRFFLLSVVALFSGLAAIGFGVLIGTISKTHEQAAPFGATSVVILAAVGGLWFPVYAMPETMQMIARISPMNWGLEGFYDVLLRESNLLQLSPYLLLLFAFFLLNMTIALIYEKKFNQI